MGSEIFVFFLLVLADGASDSGCSDGTVATLGVHVLLTHHAGTAVGGFPGQSLLGPYSPPHSWSLGGSLTACQVLASPVS